MFSPKSMSNLVRLTVAASNGLLFAITEISLFWYQLDDSLIYKYAQITRQNWLRRCIDTECIYKYDIKRTVFRYVISSRI